MDKFKKVIVSGAELNVKRLLVRKKGYSDYHGNAGKVVIPQRDTETFISSIGHLDGRIDLYRAGTLLEQIYHSGSAEETITEEKWNRAHMDLCIMASKLAYENAKVVQSVVHHWKASDRNFCFSLNFSVSFSWASFSAFRSLKLCRDHPPVHGRSGLATGWPAAIAGRGETDMF